MKCKKCINLCTYPFKVTAAGDTKFDKDGNIIGCAHRKKK